MPTPNETVLAIGVVFSVCLSGIAIYLAAGDRDDELEANRVRELKQRIASLEEENEHLRLEIAERPSL